MDAEEAFWGEGGCVLLVEHSHSDIAWDHSIEGETAVRNRNLAAVFAQMRKDPTFRWTIECVLYLQDWLEAHPENEAELVELLKRGQLDCGATYTQPLEECLYGELLVRQLYLGKRWLERRFPGMALELVCNQDSPMRGHQAQQIYAKAGVRFLKGSRLDTPGCFRWFSPDGSSVLAWFQDGYWGRPDIDAAYVAKHLETEVPRLSGLGLPPVTAITWGHDYNDPIELSAVIGSWNRDESNGRPELRYGTFADVLQEVARRAKTLPEVHGGVPNWWIYELWPSHHRAMTTQREATKALVEAETFQTVKCLLRGAFDAYPQAGLSQAWQEASYACHTMVPAPEPSPAAAMEAKYRAALATGEQLRDAGMRWMADRVRPFEDGETVVVFNPLSWARGGPVTVEWPEGRARPTAMRDESGRHYACQRVGERGVRFVAPDVPSVGYRAFGAVLDATDGTHGAEEKSVVWTEPFSNRFYTLTPGPGGLAGIRDNELGIELLDTSRWQGAEWVCFTTRAMGACEGFDWNPHPEAFLDRAKHNDAAWTCENHGTVFTRWAMAPVRSEHAVVRTWVTLYHDIKRIDVEVEIENAGHLGFEQRLLFPLAASTADIAYAVPFGVVRAGRDEASIVVGKGRFVRPEPLPSTPREVQDWVCAAVDGGAVTLATSVGAMAFRDFGDGATDRPVLAPILLADIGNPQGKKYLQPGAHRFAFSLTSHPAGYHHGRRSGTEAMNPLRAIRAEPVENASGVRSDGFFAVEAGTALVSTIKKAEDDDAVVVRLYEVDGMAADTRLRTPLPLAGAWRTDMLERGGRELPLDGAAVRLAVGGYAIETVKLALKRGEP